MIAPLRTCLILCGLLVVAAPAAAQWSRVEAVPAFEMVSLFANGDTIAAGASATVYVSTDAGATWKQSAVVAAGVTMIRTVWVRNHRIYAGTLGQGVFVSDDLGDTWLDFSQGLAGGIGNSHLFIEDLEVRGDNMYAATSGAGPWVRNLVAGTWARFGNALEANQAANMVAIGVSDSRLLATGGFNGMVFFRDPGAADWTVSFLNNVGFAPGLGPLSAVWTGHGWVVSSDIGIFTSPTGQSPWTFFDTGLGTLFTSPLAVRGSDVFASFGAGGTTQIAFSSDDGATWHELETLSMAFTFDIAVRGSDLYAARLDGLWRRSIANVSVPDAAAPARLRFAIAGSQPIGDQVRFRFDLPAAGPIAIEVFDVAGRRAADAIRGSWPAGTHEIAWDARRLGSGVYLARLTAGGGGAVVKLIRAR